MDGSGPLTDKDPETAGMAKPAGYVEVVRHNRNFRFLWMGQIVSLLGDWFNLLASAALITSLTQSGLAVGGLFVVRMLAPFLISPVAGVLADRIDRRRLLIFTDLSRAVVVFCFLFVRRPQDVWLLYSLTAVQLAISGIFFPTRNAILPDLVRDDEIGAANALSSSTWSVMLAVGAALGGLVAGGWGVYPSFVIDGLTFLASAGLLSRIQPGISIAPGVERSDLRSALSQYIDGLRYLKDHVDILFVALSKAAMGLMVSGAYEVVQVTVSEKVFVIGEGGSTGLGVLYMVAGIGTGFGPILARRFTGDDVRRLRWALPAAFLISSIGLWIIAPLQNFWIVLSGGLLRAVGTGVNWVLATQLLLLLVPNRVRGRVFSSEFALFTLMTATSSGGVGWLLDGTNLGLSGVLRLLALLSLIPMALWVLWLTMGSYRTEPVGKGGPREGMPIPASAASPSGDLSGEVD
jgi:MFS family permease